MTARTARPRKRKTIVEEEIPEGAGIGTEEATEFDVSLEAAEDTETLNQVLEQFGQTQNVLYRIYRVTPTGQSFSYESATFDEPFLQRSRGAGEYSVRIFIGGRFKRAIRVLIDAPADDAGHPNGNGNGNGSGHTAFLEKMLMALILKENGGGNHGPSITDLTNALANLDSLRGKQESTMDIFLKGAQFFKDMNRPEAEPGDWKSELLRMGRDALPAITSVVQSRMGTVPPQQPPTQPTQPNGQTMINPETLTPEQRADYLRQAIGYLKQQFFMGLTAESVLDYIVANAANPQYQPVIKSILEMKWEELEALDADLQPGKSFHVQFRTLFDGLRYEFSGEDSVEEHPGGNPGDDANARDNGNPSPGGK